jgi:hypothetical protein
MRLVGKMRMDLSDKRNNSPTGSAMTRLDRSVPKMLKVRLLVHYHV